MVAIASVTKTFTAAEVVHLAASGKLDLDAPASRYVDHPLLARQPTVRQLLSMRSGIPEFVGDALFAAVGANLSKHWTARESLRFASGPLAAPGDVYDYSNSNYLLLDLVVEHVTGLSFAAAVRRDLLDASGGRIAIQDEERPTPPMAAPAETQGRKTDGQYVPNRAVSSSVTSAGGIAADAPSLALWGYRLYGGLILSAQEVRQMASPLAGSGYGLGTEVHTYLGKPTVGHDGETADFHTHLEVVPSLQVALAVTILGDPKDGQTVSRDALLSAATG
jgi:CubicO group peptidase (beta-lactamase class C family)